MSGLPAGVAFLDEVWAEAGLWAGFHLPTRTGETACGMPRAALHPTQAFVALGVRDRPCPVCWPPAGAPLRPAVPPVNPPYQSTRPALTPRPTGALA